MRNRWLVSTTTLALLALAACGTSTWPDPADLPVESAPTLAVPDAASEESDPVEETEEPGPELTTSQEQAVMSAESYLEYVGGFSRSGLIGQLEYEQFSEEDAEFAVDHLGVDWLEQAVLSAESYMELVGGFSRQSLIDQLEYEGFTTEQAEHGADAVGL